jgi:DNA-binding beta-propeller fold protein YncE
MPLDRSDRSSERNRRRKTLARSKKPVRRTLESFFRHASFETLESRQMLATLGNSALTEGPTPGSDTVFLGGTLSSWTATPNNSWLHVNAQNSSGSGSATVLFSFDANTTTTVRTGTLTIDGLTLSVTQAGNNYSQVSGQTTFGSGSGVVGSPYQVSVGLAGNLYWADAANNAIDEWVQSTNTISTVVSTGLNGPVGIAVDSSGNLYVTDANDGTLKEFVRASSTLTTLVTGMSNPEGIALDSAGNVYIAETNNNRIDLYTVGGSQTVSPTLTSGLSSPTGVAVDLGGNLFVADRNGVEKYTAVSHSVSSFLSAPYAPANSVAVDGSENVYVATGSQIVEVLGSNQNVVGLPITGLNSPNGVSVDSRGNVFYGATSSQVVGELTLAYVTATAKSEGAAAGSDSISYLPTSENTLAPFAPTTSASWISPAAASGGIAIFTFSANPPTGAARNATISFLGATVNVSQAATNYQLGTTSIVEAAAAGSDTEEIAAAPGAAWTAVANSSWLHVSGASASGTGSTTIQFTFDANPSASLRSGTFTIATQTLTVTQAGTTYVLARPLTSLVSTGLSDPEAVAVDAFGNVYLADNGLGQVKEWVQSTNTVTTLVSTGLIGVTGIAVDGAGNVYISDNTHNAIKEWVKSTGAVVTLLATGLNAPTGIAVDLSGNVYIADFSSKSVKEWIAASNSLTTLVSTGLSAPVGVAVDVAGNVYISDNGNLAIDKWTAATKTVSALVTGLATTFRDAVDGSGNVYISDHNAGTVREYVANTGAVITVTAGISPSSVAVDSSGNLYIGDQVGAVIRELPRAFVDTAAVTEGLSAGSDFLPAVLPTSEILSAPFTPTSSNTSWLTINAASGASANFSFTSTGSTRSANITVLGQTVTVTQQSLINLSSNTVTVTSSANNDKLSVSFISAIAFTVSLTNLAGGTTSVGYLTSQANKVVFAGFDASATATVSDPFNSSVSATLSPLTMTVKGGSYEVDVTNTPVNYFTGITSDSANLSDSAGGIFEGHQSYAVTYHANSGQPSGYDYYNSVTNVPAVYATVNASDQAFLYDTSGTNVFERHAANGATPAYSVFYDATAAKSFYNVVYNSLEVTATAAAGTTDQAYVGDNTNDSRLYAYSTAVTLTNTDAGTAFNFLANNFGNVADTETGTSSTETAYQYDTAGGDRFYGQPTQSSVAGLNYWNVANGFGAVFDLGAGNDKAYFYDAKNNGTFYGYSGNSVMQGTGYYYDAVGVRYVFALSYGGNTAILTDNGPGSATFEAHQSYSILYTASTFYDYASNFTTVDATGTGKTGTDGAYLYDSVGNDSVLASGDGGQIVYGAGNVANILAFANVLASSTLGGIDHKTINAVDYNFSVTGNWV